MRVCGARGRQLLQIRNIRLLVHGVLSRNIRGVHLWPEMVSLESRRRVAGFSLVELLLVMAILVAMLSLAGPAIDRIAGVAGRSGAVNVLMNTFEQARVAALESATDVYVVFADRNHPDTDKRYRAFIVMRKYDPELDPALPPGTKYVALTKWQFLPKGISFRRVPSSLVNSDNMTSLDLVGSGATFIGKGTLPATLPYVQFTSTGIIGQPTDSNHLQVFIYEGFFDGSNDVATRKSGGNLLEQISFSRFTGRAQLEVTTELGDH